MDKIPPLTLVWLDIDEDDVAYGEHVLYYEKLLNTYNRARQVRDGIKCPPLLALGELSNLPGHYAVVTRDSKVVLGLHPEIFHALTEEEV